MTTVKPALVGGFVLSGLALAVAVIVLFGGRHLLSPTVHAVVYFHESLANLDVGAPVTFRGVKVGTVSGITVNLNMTDLTARIPVYLDLNPSQIFLENAEVGQAESNFNRLLKAGLRAQLSMQSLITGQLRIDLDLQPGIATEPVNDSGGFPEIPTIPSKLQSLEGEISELPLKEIGQDVHVLFTAILGATDSLKQTSDSARVLFTAIQGTADRLKQTSDSAHVALDSFNALAVTGQRQLDQNGDKLERVLTASEQTARSTGTLMVSLNEMTAPNSQMRGDLQAILRDLAASASSLRSFTHDIERDPSAVLSGRVAH
jgi:paraquat-inducible protein B